MTFNALATAASYAAAAYAALPRDDDRISGDTRAMANHLDCRLAAAADGAALPVRKVTPDLIDAAGEMLERMEEALTVHVYSIEDGDVIPADCEMLASIERVRKALGLIPSGIVTGAPANPALPSPCLSPVLGDTGPMGSVWGPAAPGVVWLNRDQEAARARGWYLTLTAQGGAIEVRACETDGRYGDRHDKADAHVHAIAETMQPPYPLDNPRVTYRDLCQRAAAIVS